MRINFFIILITLLIFSGCMNTAVNVIDEPIDVLRQVNETNLYDVIDNPNFLLAVNMGQLPGFSFVDKFGENPDIDTATVPETVWEGSTDYIYDDWGTAPIVSLISDDNTDQDIPIEITGLNITGHEVIQTINLTGTTRVALDTPLYRVYRMQNVGNQTQNLAGTAYVYTGVGGVPVISDTRAIIDNGNHQTLMAIYTVPKGYVGFLVRGELGGSRVKNAGALQFAYYSARLGKTFTIKKRIDTTNEGTSIYQDERSAPDVIPALTDIKLQVEDVVSNDQGAFATLDILLVEEDKFSQAYLDAIGQPQ